MKIEYMAEKTRILIVEDDERVALMMVNLLALAGCEAEIAPTAERTMQLAGEGGFDLIALDVDLPDANGFEICSRLKKNPHLCAAPVVFITGRLGEEDVQRGLGLGAVDYIAKPFDARNFGSRILSHVTRRASAADMGTEEPVES
jgi:DNA-binding response OmpR family regulator